MASWSAVLARVLAIAGALFGAFVLVIGAALASMDAGPAPSPLFTLALPVVAVASAVWGAFALGRRRRFGAALFAFSALVLGVAMLSLRLSAAALLIPAAVALGALLAAL